MGQKVNPNIFRLGIINNWISSWFCNSKDYANNLKNDYKIRNYLKKKLFKAFVSKIIIHRYQKLIYIIISTARPGLIIGKKGKYVEKLSFKISKMSKIYTKIRILEIIKPELDAKLVSKNIKFQLEKRIMFKRIMKYSIKNTMKAGAIGIKVKLSGRLGGSEIARSEWYKEGRIPLHTLKAKIDYSLSKAKTIYGIVGIKVWIFKKDIININNYYIKKLNKNYLNNIK